MLFPQPIRFFQGCADRCVVICDQSSSFLGCSLRDGCHRYFVFKLRPFHFLGCFLFRCEACRRLCCGYCCVALLFLPNRFPLRLELSSLLFRDFCCKLRRLQVCGQQSRRLGSLPLRLRANRCFRRSDCCFLLRFHSRCFFRGGCELFLSPQASDLL